MLSAELKETTKIIHQLLEKKLVVQLKSVGDKEDYIKVLHLFYSFFAALEVLVSKHLDLYFLPDYAQRRKTKALANDLKFFGIIPLPALADKIFLPEIKNHLQALGVLYVMEGSTLGGKIISKMMSRQSGISGMYGLSFFNGYEDQTERMWLTFKQAIDQHIIQDEKAIVIQSANDTFIKFSNWFDPHL